MKTVPIATLGSLPTFSVPTSDPLYHFKRLCYEKLVDRYNYNQAGVQYSEMESSDLATLDTAISTDIQDYLDWLDDFATDKTKEYAENLLSMAPLITAIASGGSSEILPLLFGHMFNVLMNGIQSREKGANDNAQEVAEAESGPLLDNFHLEINNNTKTGDVDEVWVVRTSEA